MEENGSLRFWKKGKPESNRQQQKENYYYLTGTAIITSSEFLRKQKHVFIGGKIKGFIVDEINGIDALVGYPEYQDEKIFNSCSVFSERKEIVRYRKEALPNYSVFDEKRVFDQGESSQTFDF